MKKILKFYSKTCGPCKVMSKRLEELKNVEIQEIDILDEDSEELVNKYKVTSIPTIIVLNDGEPVAQFKGIASIDKIQEVIDG